MRLKLGTTTCNQQREVLGMLRHQHLTKVEYEALHAGRRLAPIIDHLRNGWGFRIEGIGTRTDPYRLANRVQEPTKFAIRGTNLQELYYETAHWSGTRNKRLDLDGWKCVQCKRAHRLHVHHLRYPLFREDPTHDLLTLCEDCHQRHHESSRIGFPLGMEILHARQLNPGLVIPDWLFPSKRQTPPLQEELF